MRKNEGCGCFVFVIGMLLILAILFGYGYLIATSDLPDWVKFWLLK